MQTRRINNAVLEICGEDQNPILSISEEVVDETMHIRLKGELRNEVAPEFEDEIMAALSVCPQIVLDFSKVTYIASMALRSLLTVQRMIDEMAGASVTLTHITPVVMEVFVESGFSEILAISTD